MESPSEKPLAHPRTAVILALVLAAAAARFAPHPMNFTPIGALALFGGALFASRRLAMLVPLVALAAGDLFTGFQWVYLVVYLSFLVNVGIGRWLGSRRTLGRIGGAVLAGAAQFFLVTNLAVWALAIGNYPRTGAGLAACYVAGIPTFWNAVAGDAFYAALLFGAMALVERRFPAFRPATGLRTDGLATG